MNPWTLRTYNGFSLDLEDYYQNLNFDFYSYNNYQVSLSQHQETRGELPSEFVLYFSKQDLFLPLLKTLEKIDDEEILTKANEILSAIKIEINNLDDISKIKPIYGFISEEGSLLIEWIFKDFRIGFNLDHDSKESSWYLVTLPSIGEINASGYLTNVDIPSLVKWLTTFLSSHIL